MYGEMEVSLRQGAGLKAAPGTRKPAQGEGRDDMLFPESGIPINSEGKLTERLAFCFS